MAQSSRRPQIETILAYMAVGVTLVSILSILATLIISATGSIEIPVILAQLPLIGLPIGFVLIMAMLITGIIRRSKQNRD
ncbi:MAG TPA: hypothetical protein VIB80_01840 [Aquiluna sp.]